MLKTQKSYSNYGYVAVAKTDLDAVFVDVVALDAVDEVEDEDE